jgi:cytochrome c5
MTLRKFPVRSRTLSALILFSAAGIVWTTHYWTAQAATGPVDENQQEFEKFVKPFFDQNCMVCHSTDVATAGIRVDQLDASFEDRQIRPWEAIRQKVGDGTMPPEGMPAPTAEERKRMVEWITRNIEAARIRVAPKNGLVRRLTVAQYRNTLQELLKLDDDLTNGVPPDAVSRDGFVNNQETLHLSTQLLESYLEIADLALTRAIIDPKAKPSIQDFRMDLGKSVNPEPFVGQLVLGAGSALLDNADFMVTQPTPVKPFAFNQHMMQTKYRYIEGYQGNDTVRGWRDFDSIYHAVYADMRGSSGYPKGQAFNVVPEGLLLRPAIPNDEMFGTDGTYGPKANFKISTRELPDDGRFRITVMAAKYNDGLLLDSGAEARKADAPEAIVVNNPGKPQTVTIPKAGVYQVDIYAPSAPAALPALNASRLTEGLAGSWSLDGSGANPGALAGKAAFEDSPLGKVIGFDHDGDSLTIPHPDTANVGAGDFTISLWLHPDVLREGGLVSMAPATQNPGVESTQYSPFSHGWYLEMDNRGNPRIQTAGADTRTAGSVAASGPAVLKNNMWQHVAVVVRRGGINTTRIYVNGELAGKGDIAAADLDNPKADLVFGRTPQGKQFRGKLHDLRIYKRALDQSEVLALVEPGRQFMVEPPPPPSGRGGNAPATPRRQQMPEITLSLGDRQLSGSQQSAFAAIRLEAGPLKLNAQTSALRDLDRIVLTPLAADDAIAHKFLTFEKRSPILGVHLGFRRDCGSTFATVGTLQPVPGTQLAKYVFEGTMKNFPNPEVEKDNVNYLAGVREIAIHSEYTDGRDMPRLLVRSVEFEGPYYDTWPAPSYSNIFIESSHKNDSAAYAQEVLKSFATRAYRRPASSEDVESLMAVYRRSAASGRSFQESVKDALEVALTSPQFLFLTENSKSPAPEPLDDYELASKLSYFLWNGPPDHTTLTLAAHGQLHRQLDAEVTRMTEDARFSRFINEFTSQWLNLDKFTVLEPDRKLFPLLTHETRVQLRQEPIEFVGYLMRNNLPVKDLISSDFILANETVAGYYGLGDKTDSGFRFIPIKHERPELGGVLTEAAIMAGLSDGRESNPVKRGAWLARKIIAEPPADPPPNVPALKADTAHTLRERIEQHRNQPGCRQCHSKIDPWGIAFEEFDAGGRLKQKPADARSTLPDKTEVSGANDLKRYLSEDRIDQVAYSVLKHMATYGTGRTLTYNELDVMRHDEAKLKTDGYRMKDMLRYVVNSKMFLEK